MKIGKAIMDQRKSDVDKIFENKPLMDVSPDLNLEDFNKKVLQTLKKISTEVKEKSKKGYYEITVELELELDQSHALERLVYDHIKEVFAGKDAVFTKHEKTEKEQIKITLDLPQF